MTDEVIRKLGEFRDGIGYQTLHFSDYISSISLDTSEERELVRELLEIHYLIDQVWSRFSKLMEV